LPSDHQDTAALTKKTLVLRKNIIGPHAAVSSDKIRDAPTEDIPDSDPAGGC
jgi:hypothetical protein